MKRIAAALITLSLIASCAHAPAGPATATLPPAAPWTQYASPADAGFDAAALESVRAFADEKQSAAVFVVADGHVLAAWGAVDRKLELHSVRKSLYAVLWGVAESRGLVSLDATLETLNVDDVSPLTAAEKKAKVVDLLHARSGVYHPSAYTPSEQEAALPARGSHPPDTFWSYNNWDFNVAGALLERESGRPFGNLFDEWIATPLSMEDFVPEDVFPMREPGVSLWPALTFRMSARDLARVGTLWLNRGAWNGRQILPAQWVDRASQPASSTGTPGQGYAMMWWTYEPGSVDGTRYPFASRARLLLARGTGGQTMAIVPEADLVIVHRADTDHHRGVSGRDVWTIIDRILGARRGSGVPGPVLSALRVEPFASQLPAFSFPQAVALERKTMEGLAGDYEFQPGVAARVFIDEGRLYASMPGRGVAELFATSPSDFYVRADPAARVHFESDAEGKPDRVRVSLDGRELTGRRVDAR